MSRRTTVGGAAHVTDRASAAVEFALRDGLVTIPAECECGCGAKLEYRPTRKGGTRRTLVAHHWSYLPEHWTDVIWLAVRCHKRIHAGSQPEPRTGRIYASARRNDADRALSGVAVRAAS